MNAHELLIAARALIPTPNEWTKEVDAKDADGYPVEACDQDAVSYCTLGAIDRVRDIVSVTDYTTAILALEASIPAPYQHWEVHEYQDLPETTHADVLALFDRAIAATAPEAV